MSCGRFCLVLAGDQRRVNLLNAGPDVLSRMDGHLNARLVDFSFEDQPAEAICVLRQPLIQFAEIAVSLPPAAFLQATAAGGKLRSSRRCCKGSPNGCRRGLCWRCCMHGAGR